MVFHPGALSFHVHAHIMCPDPVYTHTHSMYVQHTKKTLGVSTTVVKEYLVQS